MRLRTLGPWMATALVVGNMVGSGVLLLPASLGPLGWNAALGWGVTCIGGMALAWVFALLARARPEAGGPYAYTQAAFGKRPAYLVAWSYWVNLWVGNAGVAVAPAAYLAVFWPAIGRNPKLSTAITVGVVWLATLINLRGAFAAGRAQLWTTILKIVPLVAVCLIAAVILARHGTALLPPIHRADLSWSGVSSAATLTLWALLGLESATIPAGKVRDAARTIPRATLIGTGLAAAIGAIVTLSVLLLLPPGRVAASPAPFAEFVALWVGADVGELVAGVAILASFGALIGWILLQGELPAAMAHGGVFPRALGRLDARGTPVTAHLVASTLLSVVVILSGRGGTTALFTFLAQVAVLASLVTYLTCALAALRLRVARGGTVGVALVAVGYCAWALLGADGQALLWFAGLMGAGWPIYAFTRWRARIDATSLARATAPAAPRG